MMMGLGKELVVQLPDTLDGAVPGAGVQGPLPPPGFRAGQFNCPSGSDYDASQTAGFCVDSSGNPVTTRPTGSRYEYYYALDGSSWAVETGSAGACPPGTIIPCLKDAYLYGGAGLLLLLLLRRRG